MIDKSLWSAKELMIFECFGYRCARCRKPATTLHEIVPKSKRPRDWDEKENRIPLCNECHTLVHSKGAINFEKELLNLRITLCQ